MRLNRLRTRLPAVGRDTLNYMEFRASPAPCVVQGGHVFYRRETCVRPMPI